MLEIDPRSAEPLGGQIRRGLRRAIAEGELRPGDPLPPVRQLAGDLGINLNTVARAYRDLEAEGLVRTMRGRGTVVLAGRDSVKTPKSDLRRRLRDLLADARLAGYGRDEIRELVSAEIDRRVG
jgi:GntR family transcriptional regulator